MELLNRIHEVLPAPPEPEEGVEEAGEEGDGGEQKLTQAHFQTAPLGNTSWQGYLEVPLGRGFAEPAEEGEGGKGEEDDIEFMDF